MQMSLQALKTWTKKKLHAKCLSIIKEHCFMPTANVQCSTRGPQRKPRVLRNRMFIKLEGLRIILLHSQVVSQRKCKAMLPRWHHITTNWPRVFTRHVYQGENQLLKGKQTRIDQKHPIFDINS